MSIEQCARNLVQKAIKDGRLIRQYRCDKCESIGYTIAHHPDYSKPLDVQWLCHKCHRQTYKPKARRTAQNINLDGKEYSIKDIRVRASKALWSRFENWWRREGCTSQAEGIRTAMRLAIKETK